MDPLIYERVAVNGINLEVSVTNRGGPKGLALLLHGFPESAFSWRFQIPLLAAEGYEVWAPNMRGYGASDKPGSVGDYALDVLLEDVAALIDVSGRDDAVLVAHDWGAVVAWMFAIRKVRPLRKLIIMNVPHPAVFRKELQRFRQLRKSWYVFFFQIPRLPEWLLLRKDAAPIADAFREMAVDKTRFPSEVTDVYRQNAQRPNALRSMINYYRSALRNAIPLRREPLPVIDIPTLLVWGVEDKALGIETTHGTDAHVEDLTIRYLDDVSHWVQQEAPEVVNAMLTDWLAGRPVGQAADYTSERLPDPAVRG